MNNASTFPQKITFGIECSSDVSPLPWDFIQVPHTPWGYGIGAGAYYISGVGRY